MPAGIGFGPLLTRVRRLTSCDNFYYFKSVNLPPLSQILDIMELAIAW